MNRVLLRVMLSVTIAWMVGCHVDGPRFRDAPSDADAGLRPVASLFGEPITRADLQESAERRGRSEVRVLQTMIGGELTLRYIEERGIYVTDQGIRDLFNRFKAMGIIDEAYRELGAMDDAPDALEELRRRPARGVLRLLPRREPHGPAARCGRFQPPVVGA